MVAAPGNAPGLAAYETTVVLDPLRMEPSVGIAPTITRLPTGVTAVCEWMANGAACGYRAHSIGLEGRRASVNAYAA